jgi:hypothetical protein
VASVKGYWIFVESIWQEFGECLVCREGRGRSKMGRVLGEGGETHAVDLVEAVHVQLAYEARELDYICVCQTRDDHEIIKRRLTLLCLKCDPSMLLLNSPTLETTKLVPRSVHTI